MVNNRNIKVWFIDEAPSWILIESDIHDLLFIMFRYVFPYTNPHVGGDAYDTSSW